MKTIILFILLVSANFAQSNLLTLFNSGTTTTVELVSSSLAAHWDYNDLANGAVTSWADQIASLTLAQATETRQPIKSASGVTFDGGDALAVANNITFSDAVSIEVVVNIADTTLAGYQCVMGGRNTNGILYVGFLANGQLCVSAWDGTTVYEFAGVTTTGYETVNHIVATFTGDAIPTVYVNGVLVPDIADASNFGDNNRVAMGGVDGENSFIAANSIIFAGSIYTKVLTQEEVNQNILYYQRRGYLP